MDAQQADRIAADFVDAVLRDDPSASDIWLAVPEMETGYVLFAIARLAGGWMRLALGKPTGDMSAAFAELKRSLADPTAVTSLTVEGSLDAFALVQAARHGREDDWLAIVEGLPAVRYIALLGGLTRLVLALLATFEQMTGEPPDAVLDGLRAATLDQPPEAE